ncbi:MAG: CotH kinase family protein [Planctomycetes bacterium]|nr:CotH kinase family protein [Planctomycetota bacterium]
MQLSRLWNRSIAAAAAAVVTLGVSGPATAAIHDVIVRDFVFDPATVNVEPGDTVRWIWESGVHSVTSGAPCVFDGLFNATVDAANPVFTYVVQSNFIGVIPYFCLPHCGVGMTGQIRVDHLDWPAVFDPLQVLTVNLQLDPIAWDTIRHDLTFLIEVPALFWQDGDKPINVTVRRKSSSALPSEADPQKVALKIDINDLVSGQKWHQLTKLSLETGDQVGLIVEGMAWNLHRAATSVPFGYGYDAAYGSWVRLNVNGVYNGLFVNAEQRNKQALRNRGLYTPVTADETWLYKATGQNEIEVKVGIPHSPTFEALCYSPFFATLTEGDAAQECPTPGNPTLAVDLPTFINMQGFLTMAAVNAFVANPDSLVTHNQNSYYVDFAPVLTGKTPNERLPLDTVLDSLNLTGATVANLDDDPDAAGTDWATATTNNVNTVVHAAFPNPSGLLVDGFGLQEFRASVRKNAASGAGTPTARIELRQNGQLVRAGPNIDVTARSASQQVISLTWDATEILVAAAVECKVIGTKSGGSPANRASVDIGAVEWNAEGAVVGEVIQRLYYPWDLDNVLPFIGDTTFDIYAGGPGPTAYQTIILGHPTFRAQYSQILNDLLCDPLSEAEIFAFLNAVEPVITQALIDDPNNQIPLGLTVVDRFNDIRTWISQRVLNVAGQIEGFVPCAVSSPADFSGPDGVPDGCVDSDDLTVLLGAWCSAVNDPNPPSPPCENCTQVNLDLADIAGQGGGPPDGCVDSNDLTKLLGEWCSVAGSNPCGTCF